MMIDPSIAAIRSRPFTSEKSMPMSPRAPEPEEPRQTRSRPPLRWALPTGPGADSPNGSPLISGSIGLRQTLARLTLMQDGLITIVRMSERKSRTNVTRVLTESKCRSNPLQSPMPAPPGRQLGDKQAQPEPAAATALDVRQLEAKLDRRVALVLALVLVALIVACIDSSPREQVPRPVAIPLDVVDRVATGERVGRRSSRCTLDFDTFKPPDLSLNRFIPDKGAGSLGANPQRVMRNAKGSTNVVWVGTPE
jgi:hypothetical protein